MQPLKLIETTPRDHSLLLNAGSTPVDDVVKELGHRPTGYFWVAVAKLPRQPGGAAFSGDRAALEELGGLMSAVVTDRDRMRQLITSAEASGFELNGPRLGW